MNTYGYAAGDPVNGVDPEGLASQEDLRRELGLPPNRVAIRAKQFANMANDAADAVSDVLVEEITDPVNYVVPVTFGTAWDVYKRAAKRGLGNANYAQNTFGETFSAAGKFAGQSVDDVAGALRSGKLGTADVPIDYIIRDGRTLILNTRSSQALTRAGIPRSQWNAVNRTGQSGFEGRLSDQLRRNKLTSEGTSSVRPSN